MVRFPSVLLAIFMILSWPVWAERDGSDVASPRPIGRPHHDAADRRDGSNRRDAGAHRWRDHRGDRPERWLWPGGLMVLAYPFIGPGPGAPPIGSPLMVSPIEPPPRFYYYCNDPPGVFPAVAVCVGPWLETGNPSPRQEPHR